MRHNYLSASLTAICFFIALHAFAQPWKYNFGTIAATFSTANTANLNFLPAPVTGAGIDRVYIGSGGGSFKLSNPGISQIGTGCELNIVASNSASSINKASVYDYTGGTSFYTKFEVLLGSSTGTNSTGTGDIYFYQGNGACFSDNNDITGTQIFTGIKWSLAASGGTVNTQYLNGATWTALGSSPFIQANTYTVEIFGNNSTTSVSYTYNGVSQTLAANTQDIWVNTSLIGNDLPKAGLTANTSINSWMMIGNSSASNLANGYFEDFTYSNSIAAGYTTYLNYYSKPSLTLQLTSEWATNRDGIGNIIPPNFTTAFRRYIIINTTVPITYNGSSLSCCSIGALWTVSGTDSRVVVGDTNYVNTSIFYLQSGTKRLAGTIDVTNNGSLFIKNLVLPTFGSLGLSSMVVYDQVTTGSVAVAPASYGSLVFTGEGTFNIGGSVTVKDILEIDLLSGSVVVKAGKNLTVQGETMIYCPECLVLESTSAGVASFIDNGINYMGGSGSVKVQDYRIGAGGATPNGRFHYASIPVTAATSAVYDANGANKVWYFSEATNGYTEITNNTTALSVGKGYLIRLGAISTLNFIGNL
ncbi:MAG: hypothetical protein ACOYMF_19260, partial [Bacteroidales bacterium]